MSYTNFIAAINIGTAQITGMVGEKTPGGALNILAAEMEKSNGCIRRGCVYNVEETASKVKALFNKLENKLGGAKIAKVYVAVGGYSLRSQDYSIFRSFDEELDVTEEIIADIFRECKEYTPDFLDVLSIVSPVYLLDGKRAVNPVGIPCSSIEVQYKLVVGRPSLRRHTQSSIKDKAKKEIADILLAPLALADVVLSDDEKNLGCALIDFGAGTTKVIVYKDGLLQSFSVIPFGGNNITRDITSLNLVEPDAEQLKLEYGSVILDIEDSTLIPVNSGAGQREIRQTELNNIIEARSKEIVDNVVARIEATGLLDRLGAGLVITGEASTMRGLPTMIREKAKMSIRFAALRKGLLTDDKVVNLNPEYMEAVGLLMQGTENCAAGNYVGDRPIIQPQPKEAQPLLFAEDEISSHEPVKPIKKEPKTEKKKRGFGNLFSGLSKGIDNMSKGLFDEESGTSNKDN